MQERPPQGLDKAPVKELELHWRHWQQDLESLRISGKNVEQPFELREVLGPWDVPGNHAHNCAWLAGREPVAPRVNWRLVMSSEVYRRLMRQLGQADARDVRGHLPPLQVLVVRRYIVRTDQARPVLHVGRAGVITVLPPLATVPPLQEPQH